MDVREIQEFREKVESISVSEMRDVKKVRELTRMFILLGDLFTTIRIPSNTITGLRESKYFEKTRHGVETISSKLKNDEVRDFNQMIKNFKRKEKKNNG